MTPSNTVPAGHVLFFTTKHNLVKRWRPIKMETQESYNLHFTHDLHFHADIIPENFIYLEWITDPRSPYFKDSFEKSTPMQIFDQYLRTKTTRTTNKT